MAGVNEKSLPPLPGGEAHGWRPAVGGPGGAAPVVPATGPGLGQHLPCRPLRPGRTSLRSSTPSLASCRSDTNLVVRSPRLFSCLLGVPGGGGACGPASAIAPARPPASPQPGQARPAAAPLPLPFIVAGPPELSPLLPLPSRALPGYLVQFLSADLNVKLRGPSANAPLAKKTKATPRTASRLDKLYRRKWGWGNVSEQSRQQRRGNHPNLPC